MNANTNRQERKLIGERVASYREPNCLRQDRVLAYAGLQGQGRVLSDGIQEKNEKGAPCCLVCSLRSYRGRMVTRPYMSRKTLCKSIAPQESNAERERAEKQSQYSGIERKENSLQDGTLIRQKIWEAEILFDMPSRKNETSEKEMGVISSVGRGLSVNMPII